MLNNGFGLALGVGLAAVPDVTASKWAAGFVLTKSGYGFAANTANLYQAIKDKKTVSTGGLFTDIACKASNGNKTIKGIASAADIGSDFVMGRAASYAAEKALGVMGTLTLERVFVKNPAKLGTFADYLQGTDYLKTTYEVVNENK